MARFTHEDAAAAVVDALTAAGGSMAHNDLVAALETQNKSQAVQHFLTLQSLGTIAAQVVAVAPGVNELRYSLPAQQAQPTGGAN